MAILLAQTPKGLSTFLAPMRQPSPDNEKLNGIHIQRLKTKFGTKSLPTAELELIGTRAHLIGSEGHGIPEISTILNISRLWSAVSAVGYLGRGIAIVKAWAGVREVGKKGVLNENPLFMNTLAKVAGEYHKMMLFTFYVAYLVGLDEHPPSSSTSSHELQPDTPSDTSLLLRVLTPILKAAVCKTSTINLHECMEAFGGVGYLDNTENESINISRLYRDCCVLSIWEGTTDVLSSDTIRVLTGKRGKGVIGALNRLFGDNKSWQKLRERLESGGVENLLPKGRELVFEMADLIMVLLLKVDAASDGHVAVGKILARCGGSGALLRKAEDELVLNQLIIYGKPVGRNELQRPKL